jgi:hypothetical protein
MDHTGAGQPARKLRTLALSVDQPSYAQVCPTTFNLQPHQDNHA